MYMMNTTDTLKLRLKATTKCLYEGIIAAFKPCHKKRDHKVGFVIL